MVSEPLTGTHLLHFKDDLFVVANVVYGSGDDDVAAAPDAPPLQEHVDISEIQPLTVTSNPNFIHPEPVEISDDEFIDVPDNFSPPSITTSNGPSIQPDLDFASAAGVEDAYSSLIEEFMARLGLRLRREWFDACIASLESSVTGFVNYDVAEKGKLCFEQFLYSDMNHSGGGALPDNVGGMHLVDLVGPFVLQVEEVINVGSSMRERYQNANPGVKRCLKLSMTDGVQRVFGMEYRPIKDLQVLAPAGFKVVVGNVQVRHGLLMLVPQVIEVLGGLVEELDAARQRLVHEINKPPRGRRTRTGDVPSLATRAKLAAWSSDGNSGAENTNRPASPNRDGGAHNRQEFVSRNLNPSQANATRVPWAASSFIDTSQTIPDEPAVPTTRRQWDEYSRDVPDVQMVDESIELDHENPTEDMYVFAELEHPMMLSGDREIPFTYLASLSAKWAAMEKAHSIQGRIKCFLTGVKGFNFKRRSTYELGVYVDDGSLISELVIDHKVVLDKIGYSPEEVSAAIASTNTETVNNMKERMRQYQKFLAHFEGTMLVELSGGALGVPLVLEMRQGCSTSDARLLLRRLKMFNSNTQVSPIS